jgi:hypothetical protein
MFFQATLQPPGLVKGDYWKPVLRLPSGGHAEGWSGPRVTAERLTDGLNELLSLGWLRVGPRTALRDGSWERLHVHSHQLYAGDLPLWQTTVTEEADLGFGGLPCDYGPPWGPLGARDGFGNAKVPSKREICTRGEGFARFSIEESEALRRVERVRAGLRVGVGLWLGDYDGHLWYTIGVGGLPEGCRPTAKGGVDLRRVVERAERFRREILAPPPKVLSRYNRDVV